MDGSVMWFHLLSVGRRHDSDMWKPLFHVYSLWLGWKEFLLLNLGITAQEGREQWWQASGTFRVQCWSVQTILERTEQDDHLLSKTNSAARWTPWQGCHLNSVRKPTYTKERLDMVFYLLSSFCQSVSSVLHQWIQRYLLFLSDAKQSKKIIRVKKTCGLMNIFTVNQGFGVFSLSELQPFISISSRVVFLEDNVSFAS